MTPPLVIREEYNFHRRKDCFHMRYHIVLSKRCNLPAAAAEHAMGQRPEHLMWALRNVLDAEIHEPDDESPSWADKVRSKLMSWSPGQWAMARKLARTMRDDDVAYCQGDHGVALAAMCARKGKSSKIVVWVDNIDRPRARLALKYFGYAKHVTQWITNSRHQEQFLVNYLGVPRDRVVWDGDQTDTNFFTPGPASPGKARPVIASIGLERRDFNTLAEATRDLDADVRITAFSRHANLRDSAFPEVLPHNMSAKKYAWTELIQLYRDADVVVVSLCESNFCAGITTLLEGLSCKRPVVVTRTTGLAAHLEYKDIACVVAPGDVMAMRGAIEGLLRDKAKAGSMAERGYQLIIKNHNHQQKLQKLVGILRKVAGKSGTLPLSDRSHTVNELSPSRKRRVELVKESSS
jgi:glycosyltransferase involved in cell wall biosynthesis